jgi:hypothetical protein
MAATERSSSFRAWAQSTKGADFELDVDGAALAVL